MRRLDKIELMINLRELWPRILGLNELRKPSTVPALNYHVINGSFRIVTAKESINYKRSQVKQGVRRFHS